MKSEANRKNSKILILVGIMMIAFFALSMEGAFNVAQAFNWGNKKEKGQCLISKKDQKRPIRFSQAINCGDTIEAGQKVRLNQDLDCAGTGFAAAITVNGPAVLDLGGHTITGNGSMDGIVVEGEKAKIKNGSVTACKRGVLLKGEGGHIVYKILATENIAGFAIESNENLLQRNVAKNNSYKGFIIYSDKNKVRSNKAEANVSDGYTIGGAENRIVLNISKNNEYRGIEINGNKNIIAKNKSINNAGVGIEVDGDENKIRSNVLKNNGGAGIDLIVGSLTNVMVRNIAKGNGEFDIQGESDACEENRWGKNRFETCYPDCIR
jgi:parallel beta-helix repeat protein